MIRASRLQRAHDLQQLLVGDREVAARHAAASIATPSRSHSSRKRRAHRGPDRQPAARAASARGRRWPPPTAPARSSAPGRSRPRRPGAGRARRSRTSSRLAEDADLALGGSTRPARMPSRSTCPRRSRPRGRGSGRRPREVDARQRRDGPEPLGDAFETTAVPSAGPEHHSRSTLLCAHCALDARYCLLISLGARACQRRLRAGADRRARNRAQDSDWPTAWAARCSSPASGES